MTTDYSAIMQKMVRDLESYLDVDFNNRHWKIVEEAFTTHETELTSAARAEAQRLRAELLLILRNFSYDDDGEIVMGSWQPLERDLRAVMARIASDDT